MSRPDPIAVGLPEGVRACLFDMDGVLTRTARTHAAAWEEAFDAILQQRAAQTGTAFVPFDPVEDYDSYVDGRTRDDGTRSFLASRGIHLPEGTPDDPPGTATVHGVSNRKNQLLLERLHRDGVEVYEGSVRYLHATSAAGLSRAVVSASANTAQVLEAAGIDGYFEARVDGLFVKARHLAGKPAPDMFLAAAESLGAGAGDAAVFEDALAGVEAGRAGGFAYVVGVDRVGQRALLLQHGADIVVSDLSELLGGRQ